MKTEENKRMEALAYIIADLKAENIVLAHRVHQLVDDYNDVVRQLNEEKRPRQGRRITFLYDNQRYFLEKYYLYSQKKHEYLDYIEQYPRSAS